MFRKGWWALRVSEAISKDSSAQGECRGSIEDRTTLGGKERLSTSVLYVGTLRL